MNELNDMRTINIPSLAFNYVGKSLESIGLQGELYIRKHECYPKEEYLDSHSDLTVTVCSACSVAINDLEDYNYCPNCGAKVVDE